MTSTQILEVQATLLSKSILEYLSAHSTTVDEYINLIILTVALDTDYCT